nr:MAG TPA: hypothetical protein [Crassvirales sp.]
MNIAEILKYCPKGTKLYSTIHGEVVLMDVYIDKEYPIRAVTCKTDTIPSEISFTEEGHHMKSYPDSECILFPSKDQRDWGKFRLPFKAGDIVMTIDKLTPFIFKEYVNDTYARCYCGVDVYDTLKIEEPIDVYWTSSFIIPASEEAKKELFDKMEEAGYKWNANTLELEKTTPEFKEGDVIIDRDGDICLVSEILATKVQVIAILFTNNYLSTPTHSIYRNIDGITLASNDNRHKLFSALVREGYKYNKEGRKLIKQEFKPFDKVLARDNETESWKADIYLKYLNDTYCYKCTRTNYAICIPYEGNEYLLDTTDFPT